MSIPWLDLYPWSEGRILYTSFDLLFLRFDLSTIPLDSSLVIQCHKRWVLSLLRFVFAPSCLFQRFKISLRLDRMCSLLIIDWINRTCFSVLRVTILMPPALVISPLVRQNRFLWIFTLSLLIGLLWSILRFSRNVHIEHRLVVTRLSLIEFRLISSSWIRFRVTCIYVDRVVMTLFLHLWSLFGWIVINELVTVFGLLQLENLVLLTLWVLQLIIFQWFFFLDDSSIWSVSLVKCLVAPDTSWSSILGRPLVSRFCTPVSSVLGTRTLHDTILGAWTSHLSAVSWLAWVIVSILLFFLLANSWWTLSLFLFQPGFSSHRHHLH